jgi:transcriptional regulator with XRE-family HTH domain
MTIGERIKKRRLELGLSADEVAEKLNKNRATVYRYESSYIEKLPTTVLEPLSKALRTTPAYLMGWANESTEKRDDTIADIILQIRSDEELLELVKGICNLPKEQRSAVQTLLSAFNSNM